jgi:hypothetical protein
MVYCVTWIHNVRGLEDNHTTFILVTFWIRRLRLKENSIATEQAIAALAEWIGREERIKTQCRSLDMETG